MDIANYKSTKTTMANWPPWCRVSISNCGSENRRLECHQSHKVYCLPWLAPTQSLECYMPKGKSDCSWTAKLDLLQRWASEGAVNTRKYYDCNCTHGLFSNQNTSMAKPAAIHILYCSINYNMLNLKRLKVKTLTVKQLYYTLHFIHVETHCMNIQRQFLTGNIL